MSPPPKNPYRTIRYPAMKTASAGTIQIHGDHFPKCTLASGVGPRRRSTSCWSYSLTALLAACAREGPANGSGRHSGGPPHQFRLEHPHREHQQRNDHEERRGPGTGNDVVDALELNDGRSERGNER